MSRKSASFDFENRRFRTVSNTATGEAGSQTVFHYRQKGSVVWGTYLGGDIVFGTLVAKVGDSGRLEMVYQHLNKNGDFMTGRSRARTEILPDGRYRVHERWQWTGGDLSQGRSITEEVLAARGRAGRRARSVG